MKKNATALQLLCALLGVLLIGVGVAFNQCAGLGNDPVGIVYDGIRSAAGLGARQLGIASYFVNGALVVLLFFAARRTVSIGTFIYMLPYGAFVTLGGALYPHIFRSGALWVRIAACTAGCALLYLGVALFIVMDIGVDPFTGLVLALCDAVHRPYRPVKIVFDLSLIALGTALGGRLGVVTLATALTAGPVIQHFTDRMQRWTWLKGESAHEAAAEN